MENFNITMTASTPSFGMSAPSHLCQHVVLGADMAFGADAWGAAAIVDRAKRAYPGHRAWSPPSC